MSASPTGLYLHVPFCLRRCLYCDFYVIPLGDGPPAQRLRDFRKLRHRGFLHALDRELAALPNDFHPKTVYLGGGTPTELPPADLQRLFDSLRRHVVLDQVEEFSCEANPGTLDRKMADLLITNGVNRVSLGVQSFDKNTLSALGRIHDVADAEQAVSDLRAAGLTNLSIDLLFALPDTTLEVTRTNLQELMRLKPEHVSWYALEYEAGTAFTEMRDQGYLKEAEEEQVSEEYQRICQDLQAMGYAQYELFSFSRPGYACRHNLNYWQGGHYHGCGPSAHRHLQGVRSANRPDLDHYQQANLPEKEESLSPEEKARERLITGLRLTQGIHQPIFERETGFHPHALMGGLRAQWSLAGWIVEEGEILRLHPSAYLISDHLFRELL
jgi:oxygen-independent coproporphyrinogen-3 oxidase